MMVLKIQYKIAVKDQSHIFKEQEIKYTNLQKALATTELKHNQLNMVLDNKFVKTS